MFCSLLAYAVHASWVLLPAALLAALYNLHLYVRLTHGKESASAAPWGELWARIHSVGLSLALAGGLGLFNGAYPVTLGAISTTPTVCRLSQSCHLR